MPVTATPDATDPGGAWEPERDEARRLLREELGDPSYAQAEPNPLLEWIRDAIDALLEWLDSAGAAAPALPGWVLPALLVAVAVAVLAFVRPRRNASRRPGGDSAVLTDRTVTAEQHRRAAAESLAAGRSEEALAAWFRAIVRGAEERTLLALRPGRTATEAATDLGALVPGEREGLRLAADAFNAVVYGHRTVTREQAVTVRELEARLAVHAITPQGGSSVPAGVPAAEVPRSPAVPR